MTAKNLVDGWRNKIIKISLDELALERQRIIAAGSSSAGENAAVVAQFERLSLNMSNRASVKVNIYSEEWYKHNIVNACCQIRYAFAYWVTLLICYFLYQFSFVVIGWILFIVFGSYFFCVCNPCCQNWEK